MTANELLVARMALEDWIAAEEEAGHLVKNPTLADVANELFGMKCQELNLAEEAEAYRWYLRRKEDRRRDPAFKRKMKRRRLEEKKCETLGCCTNRPKYVIAQKRLASWLESQEEA